MYQGLAFDQKFQQAFLAEEINGNMFLHHMKNGQLKTVTNHMAQYAQAHRDGSFHVSWQNLEYVHLFKTESVFHDGKTVQLQETDPLYQGVRDIKTFGKAETYEFINNVATNFSERIFPSGQFRYLYYPSHNRVHNAYNIIYHANAIYALIKAYEITQDTSILEKVERAINYLIDDHLVEKTLNEIPHAFIIEQQADVELKLGATAFALLALAKYEKVTENNQYHQWLESLAQGILYFRQHDGSFVHVLAEDLSVKDQYRTAHYEGEAALALVRFYELTGDAKWLAVVEDFFTYFIQHEYEQKSDPWLHQAAYELFCHQPKIEYAAFNLERTKQRLNRIITEEATNATSLKILLSTYVLLAILKQNQIDTNQITTIDSDRLKLAIQHRVRIQRTNLLWPELAMYFQVPEASQYQFFIREQDNQSRIDYVADHLSSYCSYYDVLQHPELLSALGSTLEMTDQQTLDELKDLSVIKHFQAEKRYEQALTYIEARWDEAYTYMDVTYIAYAEVLRLAGLTNKAKEVLTTAYEKHPKNEGILVELLNLFTFTNDWRAVQMVAEDLVKVQPKESQYYFELGRGYAETNDIQKAKAAYKIGLIYKHHLSTEQLIERIEQQITDQPETLQTTYTFLGGRNNVGVFIHEGETTDYFTKISRLDRSSLREGRFYKQISTQFTDLQTAVPRFINDYVKDDIQYLTLERVESTKKTVTVEELAELSKRITSVRYNDLINDFPNPNFELVLKNNVVDGVMHFFSNIHEMTQNERLFQTAKKFAEQNGFSPDVFKALRRLEQIIMNGQLYHEIIPEQHYSLLHGDFRLANMVIRKETEQLLALDWGSFLIGPHFMDMALLLTEFRIPIEDIKEKYLFKDDGAAYLSDIEQIYFYSAYFFYYFIKLNERSEEKILNHFMLPAIAEIEKIVKRRG